MNNCPNMHLENRPRHDCLQLSTIEEECFGEITFDSSVITMDVSLRRSTSNWEDSLIDSPGLHNKAFLESKTFSFENCMSPAISSNQRKADFQSTPRRNSTTLRDNNSFSFLNHDTNSPKPMNSSWNINTSKGDDTIFVSPTSKVISPQVFPPVNLLSGTSPGWGERYSSNDMSETENWQPRVLAEDIEKYIAITLKQGDNLCQEKINVSDIFHDFYLDLEIQEIENLISDLTNGTVFKETKAIEYELKTDVFLSMVKSLLKASPSYRIVEALVTNLQSKLRRLKICRNELQNIQDIFAKLDWLDNLEKQERETMKPPFSKTADLYSAIYVVQEMTLKKDEKYSEINTLHGAWKIFSDMGATLSQRMHTQMVNVIDRYSAVAKAIDIRMKNLATIKYRQERKM